MTTNTRPLDRRPLLVWLGLASLSILLFFKTQAHDVSSYREAVDGLRQLKAVDAALNEDVVRSRYRLLVNYDPLVGALRQARALTDELRALPTASPDHPDHLNTTLQQLAQALATKTELVEQFKSDNAVLKNSIAYYPFIVQTLRDAPGTAPPHALSDAATDLQRNVLLYIQSGGLDQWNNTLRQVGQVRAFRDDSTPLRDNVDHLLAHTRVILEYADRVERIMTEILAAPTASLIDTLSRAYTDAHLGIMHHADYYRYQLYAFSLLLLGYTGYILLRLRNSSRALFREKERAQVTLHSIGDAVITTDRTGHIQYMNPIAEHISGWDLDAARGQPVSTVLRLIHETTRATVENPVLACLRDGETRTLERLTLLLDRDGREIAIEDSAAPIRDPDGSIGGAVMVFHDVSHARKLTAQLSWQATHDALTGLVNRHEFERRVEQALDSAHERGLTHALLYLDLDQFKVVNDTCGHAAGDRLLREVGATLVTRVRDIDTVARLGGDEFGVLLESCPFEQAQNIADNLLRSIRDLRFTWQGKHFEIGTSIGLVTLSARSIDLPSVLSAADMACYAAKDEGRNRIHIYRDDDSALARHQGEIRWVSRISTGLQENRFRLWRQRMLPLQQPSRDGEHFEVLLRLQDERGTLVPPEVFLPAAERYNLIGALDRWVVKATLAQLVELHDSHGKPWPATCTINLSGTSLGDDDFLDFLREQLGNTRVPPAALCFEITETAVIGNLEKAMRFIREVKRRGVRFALDDFGSGLSSLTYLKNLPVDYIKIYGGFVRDMLHDPLDQAMIAAIRDFGRVIGIQTVAEGVEDTACLQRLRDMGIDYAQGHAVASPEPFMTDGNTPA